MSPNNAICKHCKESVRHHHKTLCVVMHLHNCKPFKKIIMDKEKSDRPDWWNNGLGAAKKSKVQATLIASSSSKGDSTDSLSGKSTQSLLRSFAIPESNASNQKKFNQYMAMHFYCTGTSFRRIEDPYLLRAVQLLRPGVKLPTRLQLGDDS